MVRERERERINCKDVGENGGYFRKSKKENKKERKRDREMRKKTEKREKRGE